MIITNKAAQSAQGRAELLVSHPKGCLLVLESGSIYAPTTGYLLLNQGWPHKRRLRISFAALAPESATDRVARWLIGVDSRHKLVVSWWEDEALLCDVVQYRQHLVEAQIEAIQQHERELFDIKLWKRIGA